MPEQRSDIKTNRWPTGLTFVLYCAGFSLVLLVVYVITSGKLFEFSANEGGVVFKSALNQGTVSVDSANSRSKELKAKFEEASMAQGTAPVQSAPSTQNPAPQQVVATAPNVTSFAGTWTGEGSTYVIQQNGLNITLSEWTNQVLTSYGTGTVTGDVATLSVNNIIGLTFSIDLRKVKGQLEINTMGQTIYLDKV